MKDKLWGSRSLWAAVERRGPVQEKVLFLGERHTDAERQRTSPFIHLSASWAHEETGSGRPRSLSQLPLFFQITPTLPIYIYAAFKKKKFTFSTFVHHFKVKNDCRINFWDQKVLEEWKTRRNEVGQKCLFYGTWSAKYPHLVP